MPKLGNRVVLTQRRVDSLRHPGDHQRKVLVSDDPRGPHGVRGLSVRLYPGGRRSYVLKARVDGRYSLLTLGGCDELTLKAARQEAALKLLEARAGRLQTAEVPRLRDFAPRFLERYRTQSKGLRVGEIRNWVRRVGRIVGFEYEPGRLLADMRLDQVRAYHLQECIDAQSAGERKLYRSVARTMWRAARQWRELPASELNPADGVTIAKNTQGAGPKKRQLTAGELIQCFRDADASSAILLGPYLRLLADTGSRPGELARARWEDVNLDEGLIVIRDTKTSEDAELVVGEAGLTVLRHLRELSGHSEWLFPSQSGSGSWASSAIRKAWIRVRSDATIALKHMRSSAASQVFYEAALREAAQKLGHSSPRVTARSYVTLTPEQERELRSLGAPDA